MSDHISSTEDSSLVLLVISTSFTSLHLCSDLFSLVHHHDTQAGDYQATCVVLLRFASLVAGISLLKLAHHDHWLDFCVLTSLLLLLVGESLCRAKITPRGRPRNNVCVVINTLAIGTRFFSAAAR
ncbi:hypothetical protein A1O1_07974 [Capronia coronata CBS 617.96]|uniref:Uncharacterized protein n=1 Tax=Capronia coronata CBS 617.96 TaxID=1182541 RepID=W9XN10_9EURO|nr:uncharacterized protein A1O1_07974 [Capronia coronata CBS 617.96]EXJ81907.1 hypothetical protein A1O1_07974 [Capronia coronata CBS 617.96]